MKRKCLMAVSILIGYLLLSRVSIKVLLYLIPIGEAQKPLFLLAQQMLMSMLLLVLVLKLNMTSIFKTKGSIGKTLQVGGFLVTINAYSILMNFLNNPAPNATLLFLFTLKMCFIGFSEEILFRGIIEEILRDDEKWLRSLFLSAGFFGLAHLNNIGKGASMESVIIQALGAFSIGFYFSAIHRRTHNLWGLIIMHALNDFAVLMTNTLWLNGNDIDVIGAYQTINLVPLILYMGLGFFVLRKELRKTISHENNAEKQGEPISS